MKLHRYHSERRLKPSKVIEILHGVMSAVCFVVALWVLGRGVHAESAPEMWALFSVAVAFVTIPVAFASLHLHERLELLHEEIDKDERESAP